MNIIKSSLYCFCAFCLFVNTTLAATVNITPDAPEYHINDTVTLSIDGSDFTESVDGAGITLSWDPSRLAYIGTTIDNPPWDTQSYIDTNAVNGTLDRIFVGSTSGAGTEFALADITFTAFALGATEVLIGTSGGGCVPGACGIFSVNGELLTSYAPAEVNIIPIPAAVWLFGSGVLGLLGFMRQRHPDNNNI
ncbi:MAG: hypothetical protein JAY64_13740 [Candidatus Thiodiazotropha weberae]|nr:hypothetical protein [Candidatus Thiodiazotropha lotti]MCG8012744.1 hypothetical protein [Candidatus Thiodiazotropha lotti]MCW4212214.1 hypothetical protein [Candidatus Thiodiazotropha lotti]MCW4214425.1 hypothetical protein [Candidatus Thiodiazotropha lotti]